MIQKLDLQSSKFFVFTRHPASFFRSATKYHLRGNEKWSREKKLKCFNNQTLFETLHKCNNFDEKLIVSMKYFGLQKGFVKNWVENINYLKKQKFIYHQIRCEELWQSEKYLKDFHQLISHDRFSIKYDDILIHSPISRKNLKGHSTGEFKKHPYEGYNQNALEFYKIHFGEVEYILNYKSN